MFNGDDICSLLQTLYSDNQSPWHGYDEDANGTMISVTLHNDSFVEGRLSGPPSVLDDVKFYLAGVANPMVCAFGLIGNIFNVLVLSRRRMKATMQNAVEQSAHTGLIALAVSDALYCASGLLTGLLSRSQTAFTERSVWLYSKIYGPYFQNTFMHTGTWLTVIMAAGRYTAICRPIEARYLLSTNCTRTAVVVTFVLWSVLELPILWTYQIVVLDCPPSDVIFLLDQGPFVVNGQLKTAFTYVWALLGFLLPVLLLAYCNVHLVRALRESHNIRRLYHVSARVTSCGSRVTPTLVAIVCMFLVLICPSELLHFYYYAAHPNNVEIVTTAIVATNVLQTINYAFNFVLYCIVNAHFRETWKELIYCTAIAGCQSPAVVMAGKESADVGRQCQTSPASTAAVAAASSPQSYVLNRCAAQTPPTAETAM